MYKTDDELLQMRRFAMAANYMRTNGFTTPAFSFGVAAILWQWYPAWHVFTWAALTSVAQIALGIVAHGALKASADPARWRIWRRRLIAFSIVAGCAFGGAIVGFYLPGERLNNILMIAVGVGSLATLAAMTSPDRLVMIVATSPFVVFLCTVMLIHEVYPYNLVLTAMAALYCAETFMTANKLSAMVGNMVDLQIRNDRLIASLAQEKQEADHARIRSENASKAKSNFLANMSHELRTPLNAILGFSEIIRDRVFGDQATARYANYASDIHNSGRHLLNLIDDVLDLSRIEAGKWELKEESINLSETFSAIVKLHAQQAQESGVALTTECRVDAALFADAKAVAQILVNLVSNAVKFTPKGGGIALRAYVANGEICIEVQDTGAGIAPQDLGRVMERFGQAQHDVAAATGKGVGLGLPIVKGLADAHGAKLTLQSELGKGTLVGLRFPASRTVETAKAA